MNRISLHISSLVKHCNSVSKLILLIVLTCNVSGAFAERTLSKNYNSGATYPTIDDDAKTENTGGDIEKNKYMIEKEGTVVVITGDLTINETTKLEIKDKALVVVQGDLTIKKKSELHINNSAVIIVEGNLILEDGGNGNTAKIHIDHSACVTIKKQISGSGAIKIDMPGGEEPPNPAGPGHGPGPGPGAHNGYFAVLGYNEDGTQGSNGLGAGVHSNKIKIEPKIEKDNMLYIEGVSSLNGVTTNYQGENSAYAHSLESMAAAGAAGLLPIELSSFSIFATADAFTFNWITSSEENNDYFTLEYSINGIDFNEIDYVHGAGTTSETSEYTYRWDEAPKFNVVYFRLKQTDYNGEYTYSDVIAASRKKSSGANGTFRYGPLNLQIQDGELRYIVK